MAHFSAQVALYICNIQLANTITIGGMNLPLALTSVLMKDSLDKETFTATVVSEAKAALQEFKLEQPEEDDEI